jgi:hypothetical protein
MQQSLRQRSSRFCKKLDTIHAGQLPGIACITMIFALFIIGVGNFYHLLKELWMYLVSGKITIF